MALLYESYEALQGCSNGQIKKDFHERYRLLNGMPLMDMDRIIDPVCTLCRDHEQSDFIHGVQVGVRLTREMMD